jgi:3-oxoisoapionate decarboxylase
MTSRRQFLHQIAGLGAAMTLPPVFSQESATKIKLGFDNFSIRALGWKAPKLIELAATKKCDSLLLSDLDVYENHEDAYLQDIGKMARDAGVELLAGTGGICPTSNSFNNKFGTAEEHLKLLIRVAKAVGSPVARCYLGNAKDRQSEGGIRARIKDTVAELKKVRQLALDSGVKIAVENHAGDMQGHELKDLIEEAGKDFVGCTIDTGNATWTLEEPLGNFEVLKPYIACSGIRDSMVWESENGLTVQWTAMGEGVVDFKEYVKRWAATCPDQPFILEIISGFNRDFGYLKPEFWEPYTGIRPDAFAGLLALARKGKEKPTFQPPEGVDRKKAEQDYQMAELERSLVYCRETLGLGRKS